MMESGVDAEELIVHSEMAEGVAEEEGLSVSSVLEETFFSTFHESIGLGSSSSFAPVLTSIAVVRGFSISSVLEMTESVVEAEGLSVSSVLAESVVEAEGFNVNVSSVLEYNAFKTFHESVGLGGSSSFAPVPVLLRSRVLTGNQATSSVNTATSKHTCIITGNVATGSVGGVVTSRIFNVSVGLGGSSSFASVGSIVGIAQSGNLAISSVLDSYQAY